MSAAYVIPCSGAKLDRPAPAGELYVGSWHRLARQAGDALAARAGGRVLILSALHGLLELDQLVEPYDLTIAQLERRPRAGEIDPHPGGSRELGERVARQLLELDVDLAVALAPRSYASVLTNAAIHARVPVLRPLEGLAGVGWQRQRLAALRDGQLELEGPGCAHTDNRVPSHP